MCLREMYYIDDLLSFLENKKMQSKFFWECLLNYLENDNRRSKSHVVERSHRKFSGACSFTPLHRAGP